MQNTLEYILKSIVDGEFTVTEEEIDGFIIFKISAPQDQIGRVIGKQGKTINAIKQILKIQAIREDKRIDVQIAETEAV